MPSDWPTKQDARNGAEVLLAVAASQLAHIVPEIVLACGTQNRALHVERGPMYRMLRPKLVARPGIPSPPISSVRDFDVLSKCEAH